MKRERLRTAADLRLHRGGRQILTVLVAADLGKSVS